MRNSDLILNSSVKTLFEDSNDIIYIIEAKTHKLLYINKKCAEYANSDNYFGQTCHSFFFKHSDLCANCMIDRLEKSQEQTLTAIHGGNNTMTATKCTWDGIDAYFNTLAIDKQREKIVDATKTVNHLLEQMVSDNPAGIAIYKWDGNKLSPVLINGTVKKMIGESDTIIKNWDASVITSRIHPDDKPGFDKCIQNLFFGEHRGSCTYRYKNFVTDDYVWFSLSATSVLQSDGTQLAYVSFFDITKEKEHAQDLKRQQGELSNIINTIRGGVLLLSASDDLDIKFDYCSEGISELSGHSPAEYKKGSQNNVYSFVHPDDVERIDAMLRECLKTHNDVESIYRKIHKKGYLVWIKGFCKYMGKKDGRHLLHIVLVNASQETEVYRNIVESTNQGTSVIDRQTYELLYCNPSLIEICAHPNENYVGKRCYSYLYGKTSPCEDCSIKNLKRLNDSIVNECTMSNGKTYSNYVKSDNWFGRDVVVSYLTDIDKEKRSINDFINTRRQFNKAIKAANLDAWIYNIKDKNISLIGDNKQAYGFTETVENVPESLIEMGIYRSDSIKTIREMYKRLQNGEQHLTFEAWWRNKDNNIFRCYQTTYTVFNDADGSPVYAYAIAIDVTEEKLKIQQYDSNINAIFESRLNASCILHFDLTNNVIINRYASQKYILNSIVNGNAEDVFNNTLKKIPLKDDRNIFANKFNRKKLMEEFANGNILLSSDVRFSNRENNLVWYRVTYRTIENPYNGNIEAVVYANNIDDQKIAEDIIQTLAVSEHQVLSIIRTDESTIEFKYITDTAKQSLIGKKLDYNQSRKMTLDKFIIKDERRRFLRATDIDHIKEQLKKHGRYVFATYEKGASGKIYCKQYSYVYLTDDTQKIISSIIDITKAQQTETKRVNDLRNALEQAEQATDSKTELLANASHDMRTPLNAIIGFTELAQNTDSIELIYDYLKKIDSSSQLLLSLINDTLTLSKIGTGKTALDLSPHSNDELMSDIRESFIHITDKAGIKLTSTASGLENPIVLMDERHVKEIFLNLLSNAIKFTPEGGTIDFSANAVKKGEKIYITYTVSDTGFGISSEFIPHMFEPFTQEEQNGFFDSEGTGLGLSIVNGLVTLMNGKISVKSKKGEGTTFTVTLSFKQSVLKDGLEKSNTEQRFNSLKGCRILLCEDHPLNTELAKRLLERKNMSVDCAENGKEGLSMFKFSNHGYYDVVLMDIRMPIMDGLTATKAIRSLKRKDAKTVPIIAMTANAFDDDKEESAKAGMTAHLSKPINPNELYKVIADSIKK